jgi:hypothetical protein
MKNPQFSRFVSAHRFTACGKTRRCPCIWVAQRFTAAVDFWVAQRFTAAVTALF